MSDVSQFVGIVAAILGTGWALQAGWSNSIKWIEQQCRKLQVSQRAGQFWQGFARILGPISLPFFLLLVDRDEARLNRAGAWSGGSGHDNNETDPGQITLPPVSHLSLVVMQSREAMGPATGQRYALVMGVNAIGRAPLSEPMVRLISIAGDPSISGDHLQVEIRADETYQVMDCHSRYGTWLNGQRLEPQQPHPLKVGDRLHLGNTVLTLSDQAGLPSQSAAQPQPQWQFRVIKGRGARQVWPVGGKAFTIGRNTDCHWQLMDAMVSRRHAEVRPEGAQVRIIDLGSSHGLYVNGHKFQGRVLDPGDIIRLGNTEIKFERKG